MDRVYIIMHFTELQEMTSNIDRRLMNIYGGLTNQLLYENYRPPFKEVDHKELIDASLGSQGKFNVSIYKSPSSTRPPLVNAIESYYIKQSKALPTHQGDGES